MKKRVLSMFMALALCLTLLPTAALAEETEGTAQTPPAVEEAADPANGEVKQENQPAEAEQESSLRNRKNSRRILPQSRPWPPCRRRSTPCPLWTSWMA